MKNIKRNNPRALFKAGGGTLVYSPMILVYFFHEYDSQVGLVQAASSSLSVFTVKLWGTIFIRTKGLNYLYFYRLPSLC